MPDTTLFWIIIIVISCFCGFAANDIASRKGYDGISYFVIGFLFSIAGILWAIGLPETQEYRTQQAIAISDILEERKQKKERDEAYRIELEEKRRAETELRKVKAEEAKAQTVDGQTQERFLTENKVLCRNCGKLQPLYNDKTCSVCGLKVLP